MVVSCSLRSDKILMNWNFQLYLDYHQIEMSNLSHNMFLESSKLESFTNYYSWKVGMKHYLKREEVWDMVVPLNVLNDLKPQLLPLSNGVSSPSTILVVTPNVINHLQQQINLEFHLSFIMSTNNKELCQSLLQY